MPVYKYLQLNKSNFPFIVGIFGNPIRGELTRSNTAFGEAVLGTFKTTDERPLVCMTQSSNIFFHERPSWLSEEEHWQERSLMHTLHLGGFFQFEINNDVVSDVAWLGYRLDFSEKEIKLAGRQISSNELRLVLEGVTDMATRSSIIDDWRSLLSEDFLAKYYQ